MGRFFPYHAEPELEEIINDPIIQRLMDKDGVEYDNMAPELKKTIRRLHIKQKQYEAA